jgi:hypothetical protein
MLTCAIWPALLLQVVVTRLEEEAVAAQLAAEKALRRRQEQAEQQHAQQLQEARAEGVKWAGASREAARSVCLGVVVHEVACMCIQVRL